jgi:hypothetical protein
MKKGKLSSIIHKGNRGKITYFRKAQLDVRVHILTRWGYLSGITL